MGRSMAESSYVVEPGGTLIGRLRVPGDKSVSHRAIMLGSLAAGVTDITGYLEGEDCLATLAAFRAMGVEIESSDPGCLSVRGVGMHGLSPPEQALYLGNSGTSMRLLSGLLAGQSFPAELIGDEAPGSQVRRLASTQSGWQAGRLANKQAGRQDCSPVRRLTSGPAAGHDARSKCLRIPTCGVPLTKPSRPAYPRPP